MIKKLLHIQLAIISMLCVNAWAVDCTELWPGGAQTNNNSGLLKFEEGSKLVNNPSTTVFTKNLDDSSSKSCVSVSCVKSGSSAPTSAYSSFPNGSSDEISGTETIISPTSYNTLTIEVGATVTLNPGDYTFKNDLIIKENVTIIVSSGVVRLLVKQKLEIGEGSSINTTGMPSQLLLLANQDIIIKENATVKALIYAKQTLEIGEDSQITGAVSGKNVTLKKDSQVTYDSSSVNNSDFGGFCSGAVSGSDHLSLSHSGSAVTCAPETVTLTAHSADHSAYTSYLSSVTLSTSTNHGDWSIILGNGTLNNGTANDGAASYSFVAEDNGSVQLGLANTSIETLNINATDGSISETSGTALATEDQDLNFSANGLRFLANSVASSIGTQTSGKNSDLSPDAQTLELQAIRTSNSGTCEAALVNSHDIELAYECRDPGTCSTGIRATINGTNIGANSSGSINNYESVTLNFGGTADSTATFTLNYPDAGELRLYARYNIPNAGPVTGNSNSFVVKPVGLCIEATETNSVCASADPTILACNAFKKTDEAFNLRIKGVAWDGSLESNSALCSGNATTPNFQLDNITLTSNLIAPSPGNNANLGVTSFNMAAANNGVNTLNNQSMSEVGVFTITATPPTYLGQTIAASTSVNIGRFYPDHFNATPGPITEACISGGFTYLGQDFVNGYTITAKNTVNTTTLNYKDSFARLSNTLGTFTFAGIDNSNSGSPIPLSSRLSNPTNSVTWTNGVGSASSTLKLSRLGTSTLTTADGPFALSIGVLPSDADGATVLSSAFNLDTDNDSLSTNDHIQSNSASGVQRYGRLVIDNAFGPEVLNLAMTVHSEYWTGTAFTSNINDLCSVNLFTASNFIISDPDTDDSLTIALTSKTYPLTGSYTRNLILSAPNKAGPLDVSLNVPDWLEFNFSGGLSDADPSGRALFGQYRGNDRIIYWREQFN